MCFCPYWQTWCGGVALPEKTVPQVAVCLLYLWRRWAQDLPVSLSWTLSRVLTSAVRSDTQPFPSFLTRASPGGKWAEERSTTGIFPGRTLQTECWDSQQLAGTGQSVCSDVLCVYLFLSHIRLFATPWTIAHQAPLSMGITQASTLEWVAMPSSRGSFQPEDWTQVSCIAGRFFTIWAKREDPLICWSQHEKMEKKKKVC